jgi:hypothetical protein
MINFQADVHSWLTQCLGHQVATDKRERSRRFLEESLELVQSLGCTRYEVLQLVDYVYGRPVGDPPQEVGGVMVTLAALCNANNMDMKACAVAELTSIWTRMDQIRAKQAAKPHGSPLPGVVPEERP